MTGIDRAQLAEIRFNGLDYSEPLPGSFALLELRKATRITSAKSSNSIRRKQRNY